MKIIAFVFFLLGSFFAAAESLYQVEVIVFSRDSAEAEHEEDWNRRYDLRYPTQTIVLQTTGADSTYQLLPADAMQLNREATALSQRRNIRVLVHQAWLQPVEDPTRAKSIFISGGKQFGAHHELEGTFALGVEHFLQADANLWLSRFGNGATADGNALVLPNPPGAINEGSAQPNVAQIVVLQEQRRMRSGELHYFDHPKLGLLVLATPYKPPVQ